MVGLAWIAQFLWFSSSLAFIVLTFPDPAFVNITYTVSWSRLASDPATFVIATSRVGEVDFVHANTTQIVNVNDSAGKLKGEVTFLQETLNPSRRVLRALDATDNSIIIGTSPDYSVLPVNSDPQTTVTATLGSSATQTQPTSSSSTLSLPSNPASTSATDGSESSKSGVSTGAIVGAVVGGVVALCLVLFAAFCYLRRRRQIKKEKMIAAPYQVQMTASEGTNDASLTRPLKPPLPTAPSSSEFTSAIPIPPSGPTSNSNSSDGDTMSMRSATSNSPQLAELLHRIQTLERSMAQQTFQAGGELDRLRAELDALTGGGQLPPPYIGSNSETEAGPQSVVHS